VGKRLALGTAAASALLLAAAAGATPIATRTVQVATASGAITLVSTLEDEFLGDATRWTFEYQLSGSYEPDPGTTNGISSLQLFFGGDVDVTDQTGPSGWEPNASSAAPPFGAGWDLGDTSGQGARPNGGASFYFAVAAGTAFTDAPQDSYAASHALDVPFGLVALVDDVSGRGPLVPVPEPASAALVASGLALLAGRRGDRSPGRRADPHRVPRAETVSSAA
jgi:hypothetical protein